jgi:hypothetical protein
MTRLLKSKSFRKKIGKYIIPYYVFQDYRRNLLNGITKQPCINLYSTSTIQSQKKNPAHEMVEDIAVYELKLQELNHHLPLAIVIKQQDSISSTNKTFNADNVFVE